MKNIFYLVTISIMIFSTNTISAAITIQEVVEQGLEGDFNCSFQGKKASKKCHVKNSNEVVIEKN